MRRRSGIILAVSVLVVGGVIAGSAALAGELRPETSVDRVLSGGAVTGDLGAPLDPGTGEGSATDAGSGGATAGGVESVPVPAPIPVPAPPASDDDDDDDADDVSDDDDLSDDVDDSDD